MPIAASNTFQTPSQPPLTITRNRPMMQAPPKLNIEDSKDYDDSNEQKGNEPYFRADGCPELKSPTMRN